MLFFVVGYALLELLSCIREPIADKFLLGSGRIFFVNFSDYE